MTHATWILIADTAQARLFATDHGYGGPWRLVRAFSHPRGAAKASELVSDRPGRVQQSIADGSRSRADPRTTPHEVEAEHFARTLADALERGRGQYARLVLVAPPHFLGLLRQVVSEMVGNAVAVSVDRNWTDLPEQELPTRLGDALA